MSSWGEKPPVCLDRFTKTYSHKNMLPCNNMAMYNPVKKGMRDMSDPYIVLLKKAEQQGNGFRSHIH